MKLYFVELLNFICQCNSENIILKCVARRCMFQSTSNMGKNINIIDRYVKVNNSLYNLATNCDFR